MSSKVHTNTRRASWSPTGLALLLVLGVVLGSFGVAARPGMHLADLRGEEATLEQRIDHIGSLERRLAAVDEPAELARLESMTELLSELFPERPESLDLYTDLRTAADLSGVTLEQISMSLPDEPLGPATGGRWIHVSQGDLTGVAHPAAVARLLDLLRAGGQPTLVRRFTLQRDEGSAFRFQLRLAFPFQGPAPTEDASSPLES